MDVFAKILEDPEFGQILLIKTPAPHNKIQIIYHTNNGRVAVALEHNTVTSVTPEEALELNWNAVNIYTVLDVIMNKFNHKPPQDGTDETNSTPIPSSPIRLH